MISKKLMKDYIYFMENRHEKKHSLFFAFLRAETIPQAYFSACYNAVEVIFSFIQSAEF